MTFLPNFEGSRDSLRASFLFAICEQPDRLCCFVGAVGFNRLDV